MMKHPSATDSSKLRKAGTLALRQAIVDHPSFTRTVGCRRDAEQRDWLGRAANQFVNSLRPRFALITG